jgi:hypothetical protein
MELSAAQRRIAFALVVFALAGLGVYLFTSAGRGTAQQGAASASRRGSLPPSQGSSQGSSQAPSQPPASASATPSVSTTQAPDIYRWLPFTPAGLSTAAAVAVRFGDAYGTFSYTESAAAYVATMRNLVSDQLAQLISAGYSTLGVAAMRKSEKQVSVASASITSLRAYGPTSLTFTVAITEQISATRNSGQNTVSYAVTVTGGDTSWQVTDIEAASAGNS